MKAIDLTDITVRFNETIALKRINLSIEEGTFLAIIGPNGGGKTTLLKVILGLTKPDEGEVKVFNKSPGKAKGKLGYVPQYSNFDPEFPINVEEVVQMGRLGNSGIRSKISDEDRKIIKESLKKVEMWELKDRQLSELSGGQKQRTLIARALATKPKMLILDEPTTNVDENVKNNVHDLLNQLSEEGKTILISTHDTGVICSNIDSIACLNKNLVCHTRDEVTKEQLHETYGAPVDTVTSEHPKHPNDRENSEGEK